MELPRAGTRSTMRFKGNTLVKLSLPLAPGFWPYQQGSTLYRAGQAPTKDVLRCVTTCQLRW